MKREVAVKTGNFRRVCPKIGRKQVGYAYAPMLGCSALFSRVLTAAMQEKIRFCYVEGVRRPTAYPLERASKQKGENYHGKEQNSHPSQKLRPQTD